MAAALLHERHYQMNSGSLWPFQLLAFVLVLYFFIFRPQSQARKKAEAMIAAIKKGDDVTTAGGIVGRVKDVKDHLLTIESGTSTLVVERSRIIRVGSQTAAPGPGI